LSGRGPEVMGEDALGGASSMWDAEVFPPHMTTHGQGMAIRGESGFGEAGDRSMVFDGLLRVMSEMKRSDGEMLIVLQRGGCARLRGVSTRAQLSEWRCRRRGDGNRSLRRVEGAPGRQAHMHAVGNAKQSGEGPGMVGRVFVGGEQSAPTKIQVLSQNSLLYQCAVSRAVS
jgi:hypothetical protein